MRKITDFIIKFRYIFLVSFIIMAFLGIYLNGKVVVNDDIMKYLPKTSETKIGYDIMNKEFSEQDSSVLNVMFKNLSDTEKKDVLDKLSSIDGVSSVDYDDSEDYNKDNYTLYVLNVDDYADSKKATYVYNYVDENFKAVATSGSISDNNKVLLQLWVVILAIVCALIILIILNESYIEPFLYLIAIGIAVFINKGTNIIFPSISFVTDSITAILQLALSMDYSIMLSNRFKQEKEKTNNKVEAMKEALYASFMSIASSSITTIVGLLALVFMSFTIGMDLGLVLAKGVILSLISIFLCLPALLLMFDNLIAKTKKKSLHLNLKKVGNYSYKTRTIQVFIGIILFVLAFLLKGNTVITYTGSEQNTIGQFFKSTNQIAVVYENKYEDIISKYCKYLENDENIDQVLCYGNTINEKLAYDELNNKLKDLGQDTEIDEYLIKIIYYNYYSKTNSDMTFNDFVTFIKSNIYDNEDLNQNLTLETKNNLDLLENFITNKNIDKKRPSKDIANILGVSNSDAEQIIVYYNSFNNNTKLTLNQLVNFMYKDVLTNNTYSSRVDDETRRYLEQLKILSDKNIITKELTSKEMTDLINQIVKKNIMTNDMMEQLYLYYVLNNDIDIKLSLNEFGLFSLNNSLISSELNELQKKSMLELVKFSSNNVVNKMNYKEMALFFNDYGINENITKAIYEYYRLNNTNEDTISNVIDFITSDDFKDFINDSNTQEVINNLKDIVNEINNNKITKDEIINSNIVNYIGIDSSIINNIFDTIGTSEISIIDLINYIKDNDLITDEDVINKVNEINTLIDSYLSNSKLPSDEISKIINIKEDIISKVLNREEVLLTPEEFVDFLLTDNNKKLLDNYIPGKSNDLVVASSIMKNRSNKYNFIELGTYLNTLIGIDTSKFKTIYGVYYYSNNVVKINADTLVDFLLKHKNDELLKDKILKYNSELELANKVIDSTLSNKLYSSNLLSKEFNIDNSKASLIYSLYSYKYLNNNELSLYNFIDFTINNVMNNKEYSSKFNDESKKKLMTIKEIMDGVKNNTKYNTYIMYSIINKISDTDKDLIDLVFIYYGSVNKYNNEWKLTIEEFINYLHDDILNDKLFDDYIEEDQVEKINDGYKMINKSKDLIVSRDYSRMVLNTKYDFESEETLDFIQKLEDDLGVNDGIYVVGNSPMALEMSKSFNKELNKITILTMIFIFVVVAISFRDLIIPVILVLIIQCAVYVTMAYISITGGTVYFIALLIVQAILMGATIDYAIVYTSYYKESRLTMNVKDSIINSYNKSIHTILSSSLILMIVTLIVANFSSAIAAMICKTISQGTFTAVILILFVLPGLLAATDKFICRKRLL